MISNHNLTRLRRLPQNLLKLNQWMQETKVQLGKYKKSKTLFGFGSCQESVLKLLEFRSRKGSKTYWFLLSSKKEMLWLQLFNIKHTTFGGLLLTTQVYLTSQTYELATHTEFNFLHECQGAPQHLGFSPKIIQPDYFDNKSHYVLLTHLRAFKK